MSKSFAPRLDVLPDAQQRLWPELAQTPEDFTLYGGTAIALRLGHRQSLDFDFFALTLSFEPRALLETVPYLRGAKVRQSSANTLSVTVERGSSVQLSFFGGLGLGQVAPAEEVEGPRFKVATLIDLAGMKAAVVTQRAELKDYLDIHALLTKGGLPLAEMLAAASIIYGDQFSPLLSLKAIAYHEDAALAALAPSLKRDLAAAVKQTDPHRLPALGAVSKHGATP
jgi:hypothetical protein